LNPGINCVKVEIGVGGSGIGRQSRDSTLDAGTGIEDGENGIRRRHRMTTEKTARSSEWNGQLGKIR